VEDSLEGIGCLEDIERLDSEGCKKLAHWLIEAQHFVVAGTAPFVPKADHKIHRIVQEWSRQQRRQQQKPDHEHIPELEQTRKPVSVLTPV